VSDDHVLIVSAVDLVKGRHRNTARVGLAIRNELNTSLLELGWPGEAGFEVASLILRFGEEQVEGVEFQPVRTMRGQRVLPLAVQLSMEDIVGAQASEQEIEALLRPRMLQAINAVAERYGLHGIQA
jgi:hypothetical protein